MVHGGAWCTRGSTGWGTPGYTTRVHQDPRYTTRVHQDPQVHQEDLSYTRRTSVTPGGTSVTPGTGSGYTRNRVQVHQEQVQEVPGGARRGHGRARRGPWEGHGRARRGHGRARRGQEVPGGAREVPGRCQGGYLGAARVGIWVLPGWASGPQDREVPWRPNTLKNVSYSLSVQGASLPGPKGSQDP